MSITKSQDCYGWTQEQAALLRAGGWSETDLEQLAEEIENTGRSESRELESRLKVLLVHLLRWRFHPPHRGRSWELSIKEQRRAVFHILKANPGLEPRLDEVLADAYELAILRAARETGLDEGAFPERRPWSIEVVLNPEFLPGN